MNMITINNPQVLQKAKNLVLVPREEYQSLLRLKKQRIQEVNLTIKQKKAITQSEKELKKGEYYTLNEFAKYLARPYPKARC